MTQLSPTELFRSLLAYEQKLGKNPESPSEGAFQSKHKSKTEKKGGKGKFNKGTSNRECVDGAKNQKPKKKGKFPPCGICGKTNHSEKDCWNKGEPQCCSCKKFGYIENNYWSKQDKNTHQGQSSTQANFSDCNQGKDRLFYACQIAKSSNSGRWLIDSGYTNHMTNNSNIFSELDTSFKIPIWMENDALVVSVGY